LWGCVDGVSSNHNVFFAVQLSVISPASPILLIMAPAMKAMKAKAMKSAGGAMTATGAFSAVAEKSGLKAKDVKTVITTYMELAASELKKNGAFKVGGCLNLKLKKKPATAARKGINPFTKEPCVFKAKPASKTVRALAMKRLKEMIN